MGVRTFACGLAMMSAACCLRAQVCGQWVSEGGPSGLWSGQEGFQVIAGPVPGGAATNRTVWLSGEHWDAGARLRYLANGELVNDTASADLGDAITSIKPWGNDLVIATVSRSCSLFPLPSCSPYHSSLFLRSASGWTSLGSTGDSVVNTTAVYGNALYACGSVDGGDFAPDPAAVWRWDGAAWQVVGADTTSGLAAHTMAVFGGALWVGGSFANMNGVAGTTNLAAYNGTTWTAPAGGTPSGAVYTITTWSPGSIAGLPQLIVSGSFSGAAGVNSPNIISRATVGDVNGNFWSAMGTGLQSGHANAFANIGVSVNNNDLMVVGSFGSAGGVANTGRIARWTGSAWQTYGGSANNTVNDVALVNGQYHIAGSFTSVEGYPAPGVSRYQPGVGWRSLIVGNNGPVHDMVYLGSDLYVAGDFTEMGGISASHIAKRDAGGNWSALGTGIDGPVERLAVYNGQVYAGGTFTTAGGVATSNIARWTGAAWQALGAGTSGPVLDLEVWNGNLWVAGDFLTAGGAATQRTARWNGSAWTATPGTLNGVARCLAVHSNELYVGGDFTFGGIGAGQNMLRVARWLNPTSWAPVGPVTGVNASVREMASWNGHLYLGGDFTIAGATASNKVIRWNTATQWSPVGPAGSRDAFDVQAMEVVDNQVVVAGTRTLVGWDGTAWDTPYTDNDNLGDTGEQDGLNGETILCLEKAPDGSAIFFGGDFEDLDHDYSCIIFACRDPISPSAFIERWSYAPVPSHVTGSGDFCPGTDDAWLQLYMDGRIVGSGTTFQWMKNGINLVASDRYWSVNEPQLQIVNLVADDAGSYSCLVGNPCGSAESPAVVLAVAASCAGTCDSIDFNGDGLFPDTDDIAHFILVFGGGTCPTGTCGDIDFNNDGLFPDTDDITAFIRVFGGGGCV